MSRVSVRAASKERQTYIVVKHALNAWQYRDLALAELDKPIVVLAPFRSSVDEDEAKFLMQVVETDALKHAEALFGREFESKDHLFEFCSGLDTPEKVVAEVVDASRVLFHAEWGESPLQQLERALSSDWERMSPSKGHAESSWLSSASVEWDRPRTFRLRVGTPDELRARRSFFAPDIYTPQKRLAKPYNRLTHIQFRRIMLYIQPA